MSFGFSFLLQLISNETPLTKELFTHILFSAISLASFSLSILGEEGTSFYDENWSCSSRRLPSDSV